MGVSRIQSRLLGVCSSKERCLFDWTLEVKGVTGLVVVGWGEGQSRHGHNGEAVEKSWLGVSFIFTVEAALIYEGMSTDRKSVV